MGLSFSYNLKHICYWHKSRICIRIRIIVKQKNNLCQWSSMSKDKNNIWIIRNQRFVLAARTNFIVPCMYEQWQIILS